MQGKHSLNQRFDITDCFKIWDSDTQVTKTLNNRIYTFQKQTSGYSELHVKLEGSELTEDLVSRGPRRRGEDSINGETFGNRGETER